MLMFDHFRSKYYDTIDERQEKIIKDIGYDFSSDINPYEHMKLEEGSVLIYKNKKYFYSGNELKDVKNLDESDPNFLKDGEKYPLEEIEEEGFIEKISNKFKRKQDKSE